MFLEFLLDKWYLTLAWFFVALLLFLHEARKAGRSIGTQELTHLINKQQGLVLDIRDTKEFSAGHITDAYHIPLKDLDKRLTELDGYKDKPVVVVCKLGQSAGGASKLLKEKGFQQVFKLAGGISEWQGNSLPLVRK